MLEYYCFTAPDGVYMVCLLRGEHVEYVQINPQAATWDYLLKIARELRLWVDFATTEDPKTAWETYYGQPVD